MAAVRVGRVPGGGRGGARGAGRSARAGALLRRLGPHTADRGRRAARPRPPLSHRRGTVANNPN